MNEGHPDKVSDQVSDSILDALIAGDPQSRVAVETMCMTGIVIVGGEVTSKSYVDIQDLVRGVIARIGYDDSAMGFDHKSCAVLNAINKQSPDIAMGVDRDGAGDQGMMFGFASRRDAGAHACCRSCYCAPPDREKLARGAAGSRAPSPGLRPDGKTQVTVAYEDARQAAFGGHRRCLDAARSRR